MNLIITPCNKDEFTCLSGTCVSLSQRCNLIADCEDHSDEMNCSILHLDETYRGFLPPVDESEVPLAIKFSVVIHSIRDININDFSLTFDATIIMKWFDQRLKFKHLTDEGNIVYGKEKIWTPKLTIRDNSESIVSLELMKESLTVLKTGEPKQPDQTKIKEGK